MKNTLPLTVLVVTSLLALAACDLDQDGSAQVNRSGKNNPNSPHAGSQNSAGPQNSGEAISTPPAHQELLQAVQSPIDRAKAARATTEAAQAANEHKAQEAADGQ